MTAQDLLQHDGVWLAEHHVRRPACGRLQCGADGAAVNQQGRLIGGTDSVGVGGNERLALGNPVARPAKPGKVQCRIEAHHHHFGMVAGVMETLLLELRDHAWRPHDKGARQAAVFTPQVRHGRQRGRVDLLRRGGDAHFAQVLDVVGHTLGRVIGQERVAEAQGGHLLKEGAGKRKQRLPPVDRSIQVESQVAYCG